ncbi:MAG: hypothetical protein H0W04_01710 [Chthoniobacterales bacterium]|nr:hypothetical protein [Chthoniobacterales bacterium]
MNKTLLSLSPVVWLSILLTALGDSPSSSPSRPGGYQSSETDKPEVKAAAAFAVQEQARLEGRPLQLEAIVTAKEQVVAGMNYRLTLRVSRGDNSQDAEVTVFRALDSHHELKSWQWLDEED